MTTPLPPPHPTPLISSGGSPRKASCRCSWLPTQAWCPSSTPSRAGPQCSDASQVSSRYPLPGSPALLRARRFAACALVCLQGWSWDRSLLKTVACRWRGHHGWYAACWCQRVSGWEAWHAKRLRDPYASCCHVSVHLVLVRKVVMPKVYTTVDSWAKHRRARALPGSDAGAAAVVGGPVVQGVPCAVWESRFLPRRGLCPLLPPRVHVDCLRRPV
jgi:hypothetical protein